MPLELTLLLGLLELVAGLVLGLVVGFEVLLVEELVLLGSTAGTPVYTGFGE